METPIVPTPPTSAPVTPPTPPPSSPPPAPAQTPPTPPPPTPPAPTPTPQTPLAPLPYRSMRERVLGICGILLISLVLLFLLVVFWPTIKNLQQSVLLPATTPPPTLTTRMEEVSSTTPVNTTPTPDVVTTTEIQPTPLQECATPDGSPGHQLGERLSLFEGDVTFFCRKHERAAAIVVTAKTFEDSRCPVNVQCIWAGEQTVNIAVTDTSGHSLEPETIQLGTLRKTSATFTQYPVTVTLHSIEDGKGGLYADVTVQ